MEGKLYGVKHGSKDVIKSETVPKLDDDPAIAAGDQASDSNSLGDDQCDCKRDGGKPHARGDGGRVKSRRGDGE